MAGKANKNKGKAKPVVNGSQIESKGNHVETKGSHVEDIENHCKSIADENVVISVENSDAEISNDTNEKKVESFGISEIERKEISENGSSINVKPDIALSSGEAAIEGQPEGELRLFPVAVKGPAGEHVDLQVNPVDSVMDLRQFLLDAPETCFYTSYDLILTAADGSKHQLADFYEIGDVADVTTGGCSLEMVNALYDDRSIRSHLRRTRDLLSSTNIHSSLSTTLAMQNESKNKSNSAIVKSEVPELEGLGFMEDPTGKLGNLIVSQSQSEIRCVDRLAFSSFNPVPGYRRLLGDLIYLDIQTLEGKNCCVTGHTRGFFVNASTGSVLDPRPAHPPREATTLVSLLQQLSEKFSKGFLEVLECKAQGHPFENVPSLLPINPWLAPYPPPAHKRDVGRAEDSVMPSYGTETIGMQRDWNEELQSCREFPRKTLQDRIMRDRALYKVNCDFVDAARKGAKGVIGRCISPINPTDPERFHMYVHNNIFFSFAMDGDFTWLQQLHEKGLMKNEEQGVSKQVEDLAQETSPECADAVETVDEGKTGAVTSDSEPSKEGNASLQAAENEQATYASANNDLRGTKAYNNADVSGLYTLAMTIIDYRGHRIVAQSIIPGILQGDKSESLLYGSVDNGKKIFWNEKFHAKVLEVGKLLHIKEHEVLDGSGSAVKMAAPVECKGIVGSDDRHYVLDLMRTTPRDANYTGPGFRHAVLRPELVAAFCQAEALHKMKLKMNKKDEVEEDKNVIQEELLSICLNPNVLTDFKLAGDPEEIAADEEAVKKAGKYLVEAVLPKFVQDLSSLEVSPMDGQTLTEALHAHGINMRYLGQVANLSKHLPHIWDLCVVEMVTRTTKHVLKGILRETQDHDVAGAIAHFLNCYLGYDVPNATPDSDKTSDPPAPKTPVKSAVMEKARRKGKSGKKSLENSSSISNGNFAAQQTASYLCITSSLVWKDIQEGVKFKYQFELPDDVLTKVRKISTIRNLCQKVGITLAARNYDFHAGVPFQITDILDLHAVVKHSVPMCADARDLLENGKLKLAEGKLNEAYELFFEGFSILQQVCGPMHREVANCCRYLAMVLYHAGDMAGAIMQQHKELIINERCLGLDHPDTAHSYGNMALFYHGLNQTELALRHMARTLLLLNVSSGSDHPDVAATFINIAMMYQDTGRMNVALRYLQEALQKNLRLLGEEHIQTAVCYHALAIAFNCIGAYKLSVQHERSTYNILAKQLGEDDTRTRDSANWMKTFQLRDAQKGQQQSATLAAAQKAADVLKARPDLLQAFQAAAGGSRSSLDKAAATAALIMERGKISRPRGMDERGARAKAEARKRAEARGVNVRSQNSNVHPQSSTQELPDLMTTNELDDGKEPGENPSLSLSNGAKKETSNEQDATSLVEDAKTDAQVESTDLMEGNDGVETSVKEKAQENGPIGLGAGLGKKLKPLKVKVVS